MIFIDGDSLQHVAKNCQQGLLVVDVDGVNDVDAVVDVNAVVDFKDNVDFDVDDAVIVVVLLMLMKILLLLIFDVVVSLVVALGVDAVTFFGRTFLDNINLTNPLLI